MMTGHRTRAWYERTTCFCWRHWTSSSQVLSVNFTPSGFSARTKHKTSMPSRRRSERPRSYCQCSLASPLNSFNCFSMHWTTVDSHMSAMSSAINQVCRYTHRWNGLVTEYRSSGQYCSTSTRRTSLSSQRGMGFNCINTLTTVSCTSVFQWMRLRRLSPASGAVWGHPQL